MKKLPKIYFEFIEDYPNTKVLDFTKDCVLAKSLKTNKAYFYYKVNKDVGFCFSMLCDVGERYKYIFETMIEKNNLKIESFETEKDIFDIILENN